MFSILNRESAKRCCTTSRVWAGTLHLLVLLRRKESFFTSFLSADQIKTQHLNQISNSLRGADMMCCLATTKTRPDCKISNKAVSDVSSAVYYTLDCQHESFSQTPALEMRWAGGQLLSHFPRRVSQTESGDPGFVPQCEKPPWLGLPFSPGLTDRWLGSDTIAGTLQKYNSTNAFPWETICQTQQSADPTGFYRARGRGRVTHGLDIMM